MSNAIRIRKLFSHLLLVVWMLVIFCFSAQPGEDSADLSGKVSHIFMQVWNWIFGLGWDEVKVLEMTAIWDYPIRKLVHMTEFGILSMLVFLVIQYYEQIDAGRKQYMCAWIGSVMYAASDEFHQLFVPDRSGNLFDVGVDACGVTIALTLIYMIRRLYGRIRQF